MSKFSGINAESRLGALNKVLSFLCVTAHADEATPPTGDNQSNQSGTQPQINYEQLIAQARKEEKEKLYPRIKKLEDDNAQLVKTGNDNLLKIGDLMRANEELQKKVTQYESGGEDTPTVKDLKSQIATLTAENEKLKNGTPNEEELRKQIEAEYEVKYYLTEQTAAHKEDILPSFMPEVQGKTKEEIDASITAAKEKTLAVKRELGLVDDKGNPIKTQKQQSTKKGADNQGNTQQRQNASAPAANPADNSNTGQTYDAEYIRNLDPRSEEYKEFRKSLGLR